MRRFVFLWFAVIGPTLTAPLTPPAVAVPPATILDPSFADASAGNCLTCPGLVYESSGHAWPLLDPDSEEGIINPTFDSSPPADLLTNQEIRLSDGTLRQTTDALWDVRMETIHSDDGKVIGRAPHLEAFGEMKVSEGFSPTGSAHAFVTLDYSFMVDILGPDAIPDDPSDDVLELLEVLETVLMPVFVTARANVHISAEFGEPTAQILMAGASVTVGTGPNSTQNQPFEPLVAHVNVGLTEGNVPSAEFSGVAFFQNRTNYNVHLAASGQARSNGHDDTTLFFGALADPAFALDVEALRAELLARGIDYPEPERFVQLRFNPDVEYALANFVPEPSSLALSLLAISFWGSIRARRRTRG
jgi:hypothetical protein